MFENLSWKNFFVLLLFFQILDIISTYIGIGLGATEANPLAKGIVENLFAMFLFKFIGMLFIFGLFKFGERISIKTNKTNETNSMFKKTMIVCNSFMAFIVLNNLFQITTIKILG